MQMEDQGVKDEVHWGLDRASHPRAGARPAVVEFAPEFAYRAPLLMEIRASSVPLLSRK